MSAEFNPQRAIYNLRELGFYGLKNGEDDINTVSQADLYAIQNEYPKFVGVLDFLDAKKSTLELNIAF